MKILITSSIPEEILKDFRNYEIQIHNSQVPMKKEEIIQKIENAEVLVCPLSDKIDRDIIDAGKNLKLIANYGAGYDNIDIDYAREKNIIVTNAPAPSSATSTAELAFCLILCTSRNIFQAEKNLRKGEFLGWRPNYFLGSQLKNKTLGIIGMGNIGKNVAKRALAFEMNVIYHSKNRKQDIEDLSIKYVEKEELLKQSDIISLHTSFVKELWHMIGENEFNIMKKEAILINTARGPLVDEKALIQALKNKKIKMAGLDVYEYEPQISKELLELENVILIPHLGNATVKARGEMGKAVLENIKDYSNGIIPRNKVN